MTGLGLNLGLTNTLWFNGSHVFPNHTGDGSARASVGETSGVSLIFKTDSDFSGELETSDAVTVGMTVQFTNALDGNNYYGRRSGTAYTYLPHCYWILKNNIGCNLGSYNDIHNYYWMDSKQVWISDAPEPYRLCRRAIKSNTVAYKLLK